jgi:hypothetical protein
LRIAIEHLIVEKKIDTFLFGSKSDFDELCLTTVTEFKNKYPHIKRIYVRAEFPYIDEKYQSYLLTKYDETYYPDRLLNAGRAAYVERNYEMIDNSSFCVIYYDENYMPPRRRNSKRDMSDYQPSSGTKLAYDYAVKKNKTVINLFEIQDKGMAMRGSATPLLLLSCKCQYFVSRNIHAYTRTF